jgi:hypothetical protein
VSKLAVRTAALIASEIDLAIAHLDPGLLRVGATDSGVTDLKLTHEPDVFSAKIRLMAIRQWVDALKEHLEEK